MISFIDDILNRITMYRVVLYYLAALLVAGFFIAMTGALPFSPLSLLLSTVFLIAVSWLANFLFARSFGVPTNVESVYITALILALIITPQDPASYGSFLPFLFFAAVLAMGSKYLLAIRRKHLFNPAALAVAVTAFTANQSASWWVGSVAMLPLVLFGGALVVRKIRRADLAWSFAAAALGSVLWPALMRGESFFSVFWGALAHTPIVFFACIMITEPLTTPPTRPLRIAYGALVGLLFGPGVNFFGIYSTPELSLLAGNVFSYLASPKKKLLVPLVRRTVVAADTYEFEFGLPERFPFRPGQYLEWTLAHDGPDSRGNRRYFTIASSPTEPELRVGVRFYPKPSSFKDALLSLGQGDIIAAAGLAGDFTLPRDPRKKLVFIAGGIGVTPFRSMVKYLLDRRERRSITLFYSNRKPENIAYREVFDAAARELGIKTVYTVTDAGIPATSWRGERGEVTAEMIRREVPDYRSRFFYISGPRAMIVAFDRTLRDMGIPKAQIKTDFFPGFA